MFSEDPLYALIVTDASIKFEMAISIAYIYICNKSIVKKPHHTVNITSTEAKLFIIRCYKSGHNFSKNFKNYCHF